jgi:hypothetical protein
MFHTRSWFVGAYTSLLAFAAHFTCLFALLAALFQRLHHVRVQLHRERGVRGGHVQQSGLQLLVRAPELAAPVLAVASLQLLRVEADCLDDLRCGQDAVGWTKKD